MIELFPVLFCSYTLYFLSLSLSCPVISFHLSFRNISICVLTKRKITPTIVYCIFSNGKIYTTKNPNFKRCLKGFQIFLFSFCKLFFPYLRNQLSGFHTNHLSWNVLKKANTPHTDVLPCRRNPLTVRITQVGCAEKIFLCCVILIMSVPQHFLKMASSSFLIWQHSSSLRWRGCSIIKVSLT